MISRHWIGVVKKDKEKDYLAHLDKTVMPNLLKTEGVINTYYLKREIKTGVEFLIVTEWDTIDSIKKFAGNDYEKALVDPYAMSLMVTFDEKVRHYTI
jgi:heme-degrading monooxygenase HmoA